MAATTSAEAAYRNEARKLGPALGTALRQTWWFGLGIIATIGEQTARVADALMQKGRDVEPSVVRPVRTATAELAEAAQPRARLQRASGAIRNVRLPSGLMGTGSPTKEEFERLAQEVRRLRERLDERVASDDDER